jgi:hypothetical protein
LYADWWGPGEIAANAVVTWTLSAKAAFSFDASQDAGHVHQFTSATRPYRTVAGNSNTLDFFWYNGSYKGIADFVTASVASGAFSGTATAAFSVYRPDAVVNTTHENVTVAGIPITSAATFEQVDQDNILELDKNVSTGHPISGIAFDAYASVPSLFSQGDYEWIQIGSKSNSVTNSGLFGGTKTSHGHGLDTSYPYNYHDSPSTFPGTDPTTGLAGVRHAEDGPFIESSAAQGTYSLDVTMYLMFKPRENSAQWVPLVSVHWIWKADYDVAKNPKFHSDLEVKSGVSTNLYPDWSSYFAVGHDS